MAVLAWGARQHCFYLARAARPSFRGFLGLGKTSKLYLAGAGNRRLFYRCMGAGMEMALPVGPYQEDTNKENISHCHNWLYGEQHLSCAGGGSVACGDPQAQGRCFDFSVSSYN